MNNPAVSNPNDFKVVTFHNKEDFGFTPEMGCMYDSRPIHGNTGAPGIDAGASKTLPYHIGHRLATNLAKVAMMRGSSLQKPELDANGQPIVKAIWDTAKLEAMKNSYITEMYSEDRPIAMSETDKLMAKVKELEKFVQENVKVKEIPKEEPKTEPVIESPVVAKAYQDKAEVIAELTKRGIKFDARQNKSNLEKLLA